MALYLGLRWRANVSLHVDIQYPFRLSIGRGTTIGRAKLICWQRVALGENSFVHDGALLDALGGSIVIGDRTTINPYCVLYGVGGLEIGSDVGIATHTVIIPANHGIDDLTVPMMQQQVRKEGVRIADDVWIGCNCSILDGVQIERGAVIAAGAVVNRSVPRDAVVGGVPARVIRVRGQSKRK